MIFWNVPFYNVPRLNLTSIEKTVADCNYEKLKIFISKGHNYQSSSGRLIFGFSATVGKIEMVQNFAQSCGKKINSIDESAVDKDINLGIKINYELFEVTFL